MDEFAKEKQIKIQGENDYAIVVNKLGEGGQGVVYKVSYKNKEYALKWYYNEKIKDKDEFIKNLKQNIYDGAPTSAFLWPLFITEEQDGSFGYLMELRPEKYKSFTDILNAKVRLSSHTVRVNAALNIVNGFKELHRQGKSYQDLNDGNFFINPLDGDVLICDNDNVAPFGKNLGIAGKCRYMAPEVVLGKLPDMQSDSFSLAVVLFMLLFLSHPLEGALTLGSVCLTDSNEKKHYGSEPIFIYDSNDNRNRPVRGVHKNAIILWSLYPEFIRQAFITSFTNGCKSENMRIPENEWRKLFIKLRDEIVICSCGCENFAVVNEIANTNTIKCLGCGQQIIKPLRLNVQKFSLALYPKTKLYECHTKLDSPNYENITGEVVQNKNNPGLWGIRNLSNSNWIMKTPDGSEKIINQGSVIPALRGVQIDFGNKNNGEII